MPQPSTANEELLALRAIAEGTATAVGDDFFRALVKHLAAAMNAGYAFVAEFSSENRVRTTAYWTPAGFADDVEWDLAGTPCAEVVKGQLCHYPAGVARCFPDDKPLAELGIESYLGVPLLAPDGRHLGHLAVFDRKPMPDEPRKLFTFRIFAARASAELERLRMDRALRDSERRFRDLYEEAPIAYVLEDVETRFVSANRKAMQVLGITPDEVQGTVGMSFIPDTPEAQRRVKDALASVGRGTDTSGVVLELRRKDNGKPIWIQWWSKPEPDGKLTRTMFVDITELVQVKEEKARVEAQNIYLQEEIRSVHNFDEIVGQSSALLGVLDQVRRVSGTDASVLITGETGTGKELVARAVHSSSARREKPLIKLNCAALPSGLVESELFGHEKGAFSGAIGRRIGRFELAHGGTIFLDEIGELPLETQSKLLRVLQEREFERVGGNASIKADVRVIAATNRHLQKMVAEGTFRQDLFYRLNVFPIELPALRERAGDLPLLVQFLVAKFAARVGVRVESIGRRTMDLLAAYRWPGNIRELENVLERAVILSGGPVLEIDDKVFGISTGTAGQAPAAPRAGFTAGSASEVPVELDLQAVERNHILAMLRRANWVIEGPTGAATLLNIHPNTLRSRLKKMGLNRGTHEAS